MVDEFRREAIVSIGGVLGIGYFSQKDNSAAGPIIVNGDATGPSLDVQDVYLLDESGAPVEAAGVFAQEAYEVEAVVKNTGVDTGTRELVLVRGETTVDERVIELDPAESQTLFFSPTAPSVSDGPETYAVGLADADAGDLTVLPRVRISVVGAALLDGSGNRVQSKTLTEGEILDAVAELENAGIDSGETTLELLLEGSQLDSVTTTVGPDAGVVEQQLSGEVPQVDETKEYAAMINDASAGTVTVEPAPAIPGRAVLRLQFNDDSDTATAVNSLGDPNGTINGATYTTSNVQEGNRALDFDGTDDYVVVPDHSGLNVSDIWLSTLIYPRSVGSYEGIVSRGQQSSSDPLYGFRFGDASGELYAYYNDGTEVEQVFDTTLSINTPYHLLMTGNSTDGLDVFLNGQPDNGSGSLGNWDHASDNFVVGRRAGSDKNYFNGIVDDTILGAGVLSDQDAADLYSIYE
jgi:hypothetical protein